jgi:hypothetical protein
MGKRKPLRRKVAKIEAAPARSPVAGPSDEEEDDEWARIEAKDAQRVVKGGHGVEDEDSDDEDEDDEDDGEIRLAGTVEHISEEFTFEFNDMRDDFANGVCTLLQRSLVVNPTEAWGLASTISAQSIVGTVIVCEGELDVFAFATVLPIARQKSGPLFQIVEHLRRGIVPLSRTPGVELMIECITGAQGGVTGIFLHQRFANLPLELIRHLHRNLDEDLGWAQQLHNSDSDGNAAQEASDFKSLQFVILLACCEMQGPKPDLSGTNVIDVSGSSSLLLHNFEDETYLQEAMCTVLFKPPQSEHAVCASLIPVSSFTKCALDIAALVSTNAASPSSKKSASKRKR